jgi:hypothetical protein
MKRKLDAQIQAERMEAEKAAVFRAQTDEVRARQLLRGEPWNNYHPSDENVTEARQFLLDAAEAWHIAGNSAEEQRVRPWVTNIKTETELSVIEGEEKLVHEPIDYLRGKWTTDIGQAFVKATFFERNLGDRKAELDALADQLGAQKRYTLAQKQKYGAVWWVSVFLYKR